MKIYFQTQIITIGFGLALLILLGYAAEASSTSVFSLFCLCLSLALLVLVYYFLNRLIAVQRDISERELALSALQKSKDELTIRAAARTFDADPDRIIQVLTNLLGNAIKFSPRGSTVCLSVELQLTPSPPHPTVLFQVKDQGHGIPADKIESIFERFHQVDASDSRKKGGTGLGLAICRSIVQQHGGRLWVESTLETGSSFYFSLPLAM